MTQISTSGPRGKGMKQSSMVSGGQRSRSRETDIGHKSPFPQDITRTIQRILKEADMHILQ